MCHFGDTFFFIIYIGYTGKRIVKGVFCFMMKNKEKYGGTFRPDGFVSLNMIVDNMIKKGEYPQIKSFYSAEKQNNRIMTGLTDYDRRMGGFAPGTLNIIAGRPAMGKTTLMLDIAKNVATDQKKPVYIFTLDYDSEYFAKRIISRITENIGDIKLSYVDDTSDEISKNYKENLLKIKKCVGFFPVYVFDKPNITMTEIKKMVSAEVKDGIVFIDYLQLLSSDSEGGCNDRGSLATNLIVLKELKALAKAAGAPIVVLSEVSRELELRKNKRPNLKDFGVSYKAVIKYADTVTFIYRDGYYDRQSSSDIAELLIWKKSGDSEVASVRFNRKKFSFENTIIDRNIELIKKYVADHYSVSTDDLFTRKRCSKYRIPRRVALYLCRALTAFNASELGDAFGGLDHSTILGSCNEVKKEMAENEYFRLEVELLKDSIIKRFMTGGD